MARKFFILIGLIFLLFLTNFPFNFFKKQEKPATILGSIKKRTPDEVLVSASIGEGKLNVFGYTSPYAQVFLSGRNLREGTTANEIGYFAFNSVLFLGREELYLLARDSQGRTSFPVSLPSFPSTITTSIGPVLLPPTVSLEKGVFSPKEQIVASGETIPNTDVTISLYRNKSQNLGAKIIPAVLAYSFPQYQLKADEKGRFSFNLPVSASTYRLFASTKYADAPSPKSNTLTFQVLSFWDYLLYRIKIGFTSLWSLLKRFPILNVLIPLELAILLFLILYRKKVTERRLARRVPSKLAPPTRT